MQARKFRLRKKCSASISARRLSARGWGQDTARCAGDITIVVCKKKEHTLLCALSFWNRHRHTLPGRVQPSTICADELNFCVRYENRWDLIAIDWDLIAIDTGIVERSTGGARLHIHNCIAESLLCITGFRLVVKLYLIEALGLLVSVSSTHYCAYTPDLSTLWSTRGLTQIALLGYLILRLVSRLDAFSVYPIRTSLPCCATGVTTDAP